MLLDIVPDQSMLDEGVAREVINRVQKLRQKVYLQCCFFYITEYYVFFMDIQKNYLTIYIVFFFTMIEKPIE